jgi:hypothetical protein
MLTIFTVKVAQPYLFRIQKVTIRSERLIIFRSQNIVLDVAWS